MSRLVPWPCQHNLRGELGENHARLSFGWRHKLQTLEALTHSEELRKILLRNIRRELADEKRARGPILSTRCSGSTTRQAGRTIRVDTAARQGPRRWHDVTA